jgi:hypothetical protein
VATLCRVLSVSRSGYDAWRKRPLPISCSALSPLPLRIACGWPTAPLSRPGLRFRSLAVVLAAHRRRVVGWAMADHLRSELAIEAVRAGGLAPAANAGRHASRGPGQSGHEPGLRTATARSWASARWGAVAMAETRRRPSASVPPAQLSCWLVTASPHGAPPGSPASTTSRGAPTPTAGGPRWGLGPLPRSSGGGRLSRSSPPSDLSTKPG